MLASLALTAALMATPGATAGGIDIDAATDVSVKAAFLYNFAKFVDWPALRSGAPLIFCFVGDGPIASAFSQTTRDRRIGDHPLNTTQPLDSGAWRSCNVLFVPDAEMARSAAGWDAIKTLPVLIVSDGNGFAQSGGMIELYVEDGRMRFAINVDAAERAGLHISSRLLGLAKVVRSPVGQ